MKITVLKINLITGRYSARTGQAHGKPPEAFPSLSRFYAALVNSAMRSQYPRKKIELLLSDFEKEALPSVYLSKVIKQGKVSDNRIAYVPVNDKGTFQNLGYLPEERPKQENPFSYTIYEVPYFFFAWKFSQHFMDKHFKLFVELAQEITTLGKSESVVFIESFQKSQNEFYTRIEEFEKNLLTNESFENRLLFAKYVPQRKSVLGQVKTGRKVDLRREPFSQKVRVYFPGSFKELEKAFVKNANPRSSNSFQHYVEEDYSQDVARYSDLLVWRLKAGTAFSQKQICRVMDEFRASLNSRLSHLVENDRQVPVEVHGHLNESEKIEHPYCSFIPLINAGNNYADGNIAGIGVLIPNCVKNGFPDKARNIYLKSLIEHVAMDINELGKNKLKLSYISSPEKKEEHLLTSYRHYARKSKVWKSVTPIVFGHYPKKGIYEEVIKQIKYMCKQQNLPEPTKIDFNVYPNFWGTHHSSAYSSERENDYKKTMQRHIQLEFPYPIKGPIVLGYRRNYGLGLMLPARKLSYTEVPNCEETEYR